MNLSRMTEWKPVMVNTSGSDGGVDEGILKLSPSQTRRLLDSYYENARLPSPAGGFFQMLRVKSEEDGSGVALLECGSSSLRYLLKIPKAKRVEKKDIQTRMERGEELQCPRHLIQLLNRVGNRYVCRKCGVTYAVSK